ncbi:hypothetical protein AHiyo6_13630 [Arthrobacter sp. Hiyo6]|nr:hypothetical protein AHiyo6_13630 [Arthrobacter sp. Hiyo6]
MSPELLVLYQRRLATLNHYFSTVVALSSVMVGDIAGARHVA